MVYGETFTFIFFFFLCVWFWLAEWRVGSGMISCNNSHCYTWYEWIFGDTSECFTLIKPLFASHFFMRLISKVKDLLWLRMITTTAKRNIHEFWSSKCSGIFKLLFSHCLSISSVKINLFTSSLPYFPLLIGPTVSWWLQVFLQIGTFNSTLSLIWQWK